MIVDIFLKIAQNIPLSQSEMEELSSYISASHTTTAKITNMREIGELAYDLGEVWAGRFIASADPNNNDVASSAFTGTYMDAEGVTGKNAGTVQVQLRSSDGKITAGAGEVLLNGDGIEVSVPNSYSPINSYKFVSGSNIASQYSVYDGGSRIVEISALESASSINTNFYIWSNCPNGKNSYLYLRAEHDNDGTPSEIKIENGPLGADRKVTISADTITLSGTLAGSIVAGTYTPTPTKVTNFTTGTVTMRTCQYMRVGSVVTVSGAFNADPDATGSCVFTFTLPIASNFANSYELAGAGATDQTTPVALMIRGSSTADAAVVSWSATTASAQEAYFTLTYRII